MLMTANIEGNKNKENNVEYTGKSIGTFEWVDKYEDLNENLYESIFRDTIPNLIKKRLFPMIGVYLGTTGGLTASLLAKMYTDNVWVWAFIILFSTLMASVILHGLLRTTSSNLTKLEERTNTVNSEKDMLEGTMCLKGVILPLMLFIQPLIWVYKYLTIKYNVKMNQDIRVKLKNTFNKDFGEVLLLLNREVELPNGYITYFKDILNGDKEGIKPNITYRVLRDLGEDKKKKNIVHGVKLKGSELEDYYNKLYEDYSIAKNYESNLIKYKELEAGELQRREELEFIRKNAELNSQKREEVIPYLTTEKRKVVAKRMQEEVDKSLARIKREHELNKEYEKQSNLIK